MKHIILTAMTLMIGMSVMAQPQGNGPEMFNAEETAQLKADQMKSELSLTDKQYKKVLSIFKQEQNSLHPSMSGMGGGMMGGDMGGGPGGMGGGMMGGPGGGMPGGDMGGGPGMGQGGMDGGFGPGAVQLTDKQKEKIIDKKKKQLQKILTEEQFNKWSENHPEEFIIADEDWEPFGNM